MKDRIKNQDAYKEMRDEDLKTLSRTTTGMILVPVIVLVVVPILVVWLAGAALLLMTLIGYLVAGFIATYSLSNSCGILANVQDFVISTHINPIITDIGNPFPEDDDKMYGGMSDPQTAAMAGGYAGYGLREPYALSFTLFFKIMCLFAFVGLPMSTKYGFIGKAVGAAGAAPAAK